jgi:hypothetical protein
VKVIPVSELLPLPARAPQLPLFDLVGGSPWLEGGSSDLLRAHDVPATSLRSPDDLIEFLRAVTPIDWDRVEISARAIRSGSLVAVGSANDLQVLDATVRRLAASAARPIELRATLYAAAAGAELAGSVETQDELRRLLQGAHARLLWEGRTSARSGMLAALDAVRSALYTRDLDVEIAEASDAFDPIIAGTFEGVGVRVVPHLLSGSRDAVLFCQLALGDRVEQIRPRASGPADAPPIQVPRIARCAGTFAGRIPSGGALVAVGRGADLEESRVLVIEASWQDPPDEQAEEVALFPVSALIAPSCRSSTQVRWSYEEHPAFALRFDQSEDANAGPLDPESLAALLHAALGDESGEVSVHGGWLVVTGAAAARRDAAALVARLEEQMLRGVTVRVRTELDAGGARDEASRVELLHASIPVLVGFHHFLMLGSDSTAVLDANVEVAKKASTGDPMVHTLFSGAALAVSARDASHGVAVDAHVTLSLPVQAGVDPTPGRDFPILDRVEHARASFRAVGAAKGAHDLGQGPTVEHRGRSARVRQTLVVADR